MIRHRTILVLAALILGTQLSAQEEGADSLDNVFFLRKELAFKLMAHSLGFGTGVISTYSPTVFKKRIFEAEILNMKARKEVKLVYPYADNSKSYVYGKLNYVFLLRAGMGYQHQLNRKPYWGGVEVRYFYHAGLSLGFAKPIYLYIINYSPAYDDYTLTTERYDPDLHFADNIYGRAPFGKGFDQLSVYPGLYGKFGFSFDFGADHDRVKTLETGLVVDGYPKAIQIMAFNDPVNLFINVYLSLHLGKRFNRQPDLLNRKD